MIVVDTSVLIDFLRGDNTPGAARLAALEATGVDYAIPMICAQEVMQGARNEREWRLLERSFQTQRLLVPIDSEAVHWEAARIFFDCRRRGQTVRSAIDCWIAALVIEQGGVLLHDDIDFDRIAKVRKIQTLR